jgi:hypothetical protein
MPCEVSIQHRIASVWNQASASAFVNRTMGTLIVANPMVFEDRDAVDDEPPADQFEGDRSDEGRPFVADLFVAGDTQRCVLGESRRRMSIP